MLRPSGSSDAEWVLFTAYHDRIQGYVLGMVHDPAEAEDLTQETFLRAYRGQDSLRDPNAVRGWLYRIATHVCLDRLRRRVLHVSIDSEEASDRVESVAALASSGLPVTFTVAGSPNNYLPGNGVQRPDLAGSVGQIAVQNWTIGDRFNTKIKSSMWNISAFGNPAAFTAGTMGRSMIDGPPLVWSQTSVSKNLKIKELANLEVRYDINDVSKNSDFVNPSVVDLGSPRFVGKPTATQGGGCCLGGQFVGTFVVKLAF